MQKSGKALNFLHVGTRHMHFARLAPSEHSRLTELVCFKTLGGANLVRHSHGSSDVDDVVRYGVSYTMRCLTESKAGGRFLSPNNDNLLAWDRHAEAVRHENGEGAAPPGGASKGRSASIDMDSGDRPACEESFKVIHLVATNMRRDWQEDPGAYGEALPSSRFALITSLSSREARPANLSVA